MRINFAHLHEPSTAGGYVDFAVFDANATSGRDEDRSDVLTDLTMRARHSGYKIDVSALMYQENGRLQTYGDTVVVEYLKRVGLPRWTDWINA